MTRILYWAYSSPPAWRMRAALEEKGLEYDSRRLDLMQGEQKAQDVLALNPRGKVPTFKDGDAVVSESLAGLLYLERAYPEPALTPKDPAGYALVLQRVAETTSLHTAFRDAVLPLYRGLLKTEADKAAWQEKLEELKKELGYWEGYLEKSAHIAGPDFSLADLALAPFLLATLRFGATLEAFPKLQAYTQKVAVRPSLAKTVPWQGISFLISADFYDHGGKQSRALGLT